jgi:hypothetical protein
MLVHKFYLVECIQVEFKFELNSNRFEWKQESESVIPSFLSHSCSLSFLSHSFLSLSHSFYSQSSLIFSVIPSVLSHSFFSQSFSFFPQLFLLSRSFPQLDSSSVSLPRRPASLSLPVAPLCCAPRALAPYPSPRPGQHPSFPLLLEAAAPGLNQAATTPGRAEFRCPIDRTPRTAPFLAATTSSRFPSAASAFPSFSPKPRVAAPPLNPRAAPSLTEPHRRNYIPASPLLHRQQSSRFPDVVRVAPCFSPFFSPSA